MNKCGDIMSESEINTLLTKTAYTVLKSRPNPAANPHSASEKRSMKLYSCTITVLLWEHFLLFGKRRVQAQWFSLKLSPLISCQTFEGRIGASTWENPVCNKANKYYTWFFEFEVSAGYQHTLTEQEKLKIMVKKCTSPTYMLDVNGTLAKACSEIETILLIANLWYSFSQIQPLGHL